MSPDEDPVLKKPLERAVRFIIEAQNQNHGAWDYRPKSNRIDTSVSGWQIMALRSARMAGIKIKDRPFQLAAKWLDTIGAAVSEPFVVTENGGDRLCSVRRELIVID